MKLFNKLVLITCLITLAICTKNLKEASNKSSTNTNTNSKSNNKMKATSGMKTVSSSSYKEHVTIKSSKERMNEAENEQNELLKKTKTKTQQIVEAGTTTFPVYNKEATQTFDKNVPVDELKALKNNKNKNEQPLVGDHSKPLSYPKDVKDLKGPPITDAMQVTNKSQFNLTNPPPKDIVLEPVSYVKEISPAGKASLELAESGDYEYQKLLNAGFESPKTITQVITDTPTRVDKAASMSYLWKPIDPREKDFWKNVEFNKYGNRLLDTARWSTPAKFEKNEFGNVVVHGPSNAPIQITTPAKKTVSSTSIGFLSVDEQEDLSDMSQLDDQIDMMETMDTLELLNK